MTSFTTFALQTYSANNTVQVSSTANMVSGVPITFAGSAFGNIAPGANYYVGNITAVNNITLTTLPGGAVWPVANGTGNMTATFTGAGQEIINTGTAPDDGTGSPLRTAFTDTNVNFDQIFAAGPVGSNIRIVNNTISTVNTNGNLVLNPNGIGNVVANAHVIPDTANIRNLGSQAQRFATVYTQYLDVNQFTNLTISTANLHILGGNAGYFLQTDGAGNLTWALSGGAYSNANVAAYLPTYSGNIANLTITGNLTVIGNTVTANIVEQVVTVVGNITGGNLLTANAVSAGGNVTAKNISTNGNIVIANGRIDLNSYGNPTFNSIGYGVAGPTSALNIQAGPDQNIALYTLNSFYSWKFDQTGNLTAPGNVTAAGNVSGNYILGNGSQLTGLPASYSNANVAAYLPTYSGNVGFGNLVLATAGANTHSVIRQNQNPPVGSEPFGIEMLTTSDTAGIYSSVSAGPDYVTLNSSNGGNANVVLQGGYGVTVSTTDPVGNNEHAWTFGIDGTTFFPDGTNFGNINGANTIGFAANPGSAFTIGTTGGTWAFDTDGNLTLPASGIISDTTADGIGLTVANPPTVIVISGADFTAVNITYDIDPGQATPTWVPANYTPGADPYILFDGTWGIWVPGFGAPLYVNTGSITAPLTQWNTNPPLGSVAPTGVYLFNNPTWAFDPVGGTVFPTLDVQRGDNPSGTITGQTLLFGDSNQEAIISTPDGVPGNEYSQRLVINPGAGNNYGEGGDIYLWAGRGGNGSGSGGDIKIRGGQGGANTSGGTGGDGGYIRIEGGDAASTGGYAGYIDITGGSSNAVGGYVTITGGSGQTQGGDANINGGFTNSGPGGRVNINGGGSGNGLSQYGNINIVSGINTWAFNNAGNLTLPAGGNLVVASGSITGDGASPAPSINGFDSIRAITFSASGNINGHQLSLNANTGNVLTAVERITADGFAQPPQNPGVMLQTSGQTGVPARVYFDGVGNYAAYIGRRYNGTPQAPTQPLAGNILARFGATPYTSNGWPSLSTTRIDMIATEDQTATAQGSKIVMSVTTPGSNVLANIVTVLSSGVSVVGGIGATGNISADNVFASGVSVVGNIAAGNVFASGVSVVGNISANNMTLSSNLDGNINSVMNILADGAFQPVSAPGTMLHITGQTGVQTRFIADGANNYVTYTNRIYGGTPSAPTAVTANTLVVRYGANPYLGTGWSGNSSARIDMWATEAQTAANRGSSIVIAVTSNGNSVIGNVATFTGTGLSVAGNVTAQNFIGNGSQLTNIPTQTTGSWTLAAGTNTVSLTVPGPGTYSIWVNGNIPNGIVTYTATVVVTNNNVPVVGSSYGWYYATGSALVLTAIPTQIVGSLNTISTAVVVTTTANVFTFGITNNSGTSQVVNWGYTKL